MRMFLVFAASCMALFGLTLSESIDLAVDNSPKVSISKSNIKYGEYLEDEARASYHPTLDAGFAWQKIENTTAFSFSPTYNYSLSLKYNLFNGFSDYSTISSKKSDLEVFKLENISVIADLKLSVIRSYTDYLKAKKSIKTQEEQLASLIKQYDDTRVRYEQGVVAKNELLLIDVEKLKVEQDLIKAKSDSILARSNLENSIGVPIADSDTIDDFDAAVDTEKLEDISLLESKMMQKRSEIKAMLFKNKSLISQKDAVRGNYLPKVNVETAYQVNDQERGFDTSVVQPKDQTTLNLNVSWNLYSGFRGESKMRALLEQASQQNYQLHQLKLDLKNQLIKAYEEFRVAKSAKHVAARAIESAKENYRITADRYSYGDIDTLTLLVSQSTLTRAVNEYNNAYYDLYVAYKTLERITSE